MSTRKAAVHARRGEVCRFCGATVRGNGGRVAHGRSHVRAGDAVELVGPTGRARVFLPAVDAELKDEWLLVGWTEVP